MTSKIIRTPTRAEGGITDEERVLMKAHSELWIKRAFRTEPIDPEKITAAIKSLYAAADLAEPRVIIAPSPLVMAYAYGAYKSLLAKGMNVNDLPDIGLFSSPEGDPVANAKAACRVLAGEDGIKETADWNSHYQGGNMWASYECFLTAARDILGLVLPSHEKYKTWENCAIEGGFRVLQKEFCIVSDFPEYIKIDEQNRGHCENGPSHRWRDGWQFYHWHGVKVPDHWIPNRLTIDPQEIIAHKNVEVRAAGVAIVGMVRMMGALNAKVIDDSGNDTIGQLIEVKLDGIEEAGYYLRAVCPRNGTIMEGVPRVSDIDGLPITKAIHAQAWRIGETQAEFQMSTKRT